MKKLLFFSSMLCILLSITSCATFLNDNYKHVTVYSNIKNATIILNDSLYTSPASIKVKRDNKPLKFTLKSDSLNLSKEFLIKSKSKGAFVWGNLPMTIAAPVGLLIDVTNEKRFEYPSIIHLNYFDENLTVKEMRAARHKYFTENEDYMEDYAQELRREERAKAFEKNKLRTKGDIIHNYILPGLTVFNARPEGPKMNTAGLMKVGYGMDYLYKDNMFVNADVILKTNFFDPIFSTIFLKTRIANPELSITNNHRLNRFEVGYGLSFQYFFYFTSVRCIGCSSERPEFAGDLITEQKPNIKEGYFTLSPKIKTAYQLNRRLYVGAFYQPSLLKFSSSSNNTGVDHIFGIDFRFKAKSSKKFNQ
ncbi:hypothetical protein H1R17_09640 [Flavobacterium sp. xlx-214]|uniref:hypothetical protein n=1 Tax=unclassified Flavobacterium TaxID=196869 RepID=UPI0013D4FFD6|nr:MULTISPECIES: hypothetical protein [unclassified Flavobacterium]MBA5793500.1 hypothetical protein [Flavobacterium sp. xlx-221]QMI82730.1 hypothetical protein H1R17_09640 [Flavobacterium sp. xlx-214]